MTWYKEIGLSLVVCNLCGSLVCNISAHSDWHIKIDKLKDSLPKESTLPKDSM